MRPTSAGCWRAMVWSHERTIRHRSPGRHRRHRAARGRAGPRLPAGPAPRRPRARGQSVRTPEAVAALLHDQLPFHFRDPLDSRIEEFERRSAGAAYSPDVLRHFAKAGYGDIDVEPLLAGVRRQVLVLAGRHD